MNLPLAFRLSTTWLNRLGHTFSVGLSVSVAMGGNVYLTDPDRLDELVPEEPLMGFGSCEISYTGRLCWNGVHDQPSTSGPRESPAVAL